MSVLETRLLRTNVTDYHINIFCSEEDGGYVADIPDLDACSAFGRTPEEALAELETAKKAWLEAARATGKPIPPRYRPLIYQTAGDEDDALPEPVARDRPGTESRRT
jgi:predicted RNase H-like HicB family nuclease